MNLDVTTETPENTFTQINWRILGLKRKSEMISVNRKYVFIYLEKASQALSVIQHLDSWHKGIAWTTSWPQTLLLFMWCRPARCVECKCCEIMEASVLISKDWESQEISSRVRVPLGNLWEENMEKGSLNYNRDPRILELPRAWNICQREARAMRRSSSRESPCAVHQRFST